MDINSWFGLSSKKEYKLNLHFHDDDSFEFRKLEIEYACLVEKVQEKIVAAFRHFYKLEYDFEGYKALPAGKLTITTMRDVVCDLFNNLDEKKDNIQRGTAMDRPFITDIARNGFYKAKNQKVPSLMLDRFSIVAIILVAAEAIGIIIKVVT